MVTLPFIASQFKAVEFSHCPYAAPPLVCTTLSVKTAVNPKSHQHEIVAVNHLVSATVAQQSLYFTAFVAHNAPCVFGRVGT